MTTDLANAIAASAYNVCGPRSGAFATPSTVASFDRALVANCLAEYVTAHDGEMFTKAQLREARDMFVAA